MNQYFFNLFEPVRKAIRENDVETFKECVYRMHTTSSFPFTMFESFLKEHRGAALLVYHRRTEMIKYLYSIHVYVIDKYLLFRDLYFYPEGAEGETSEKGARSVLSLWKFILSNKLILNFPTQLCNLGVAVGEGSSIREINRDLFYAFELTMKYFNFDMSNLVLWESSNSNECLFYNIYKKLHREWAPFVEYELENGNTWWRREMFCMSIDEHLELYFSLCEKGLIEPELDEIVGMPTLYRIIKEVRERIVEQYKSIAELEMISQDVRRFIIETYV